MKKPIITGDWQLLFRPEKSGNYVNDHSIIQDNDGVWHLFGITSHTGRPSQERYFVHAHADSLISENGMIEDGIVIDNGTKAWAPGIIKHNKDFYMYYGPSPTKLDISYDLKEWMGYEIKLCGIPLYSCHRDHFVIKINDYTWAMYVSGVKDQYGSIACLVSNDLLNWRFVQYALTSGGDAPLRPSWGAFESPYVVKHEDVYYLFVTYTNCNTENYQDTLVFASTNPYDFGHYTGNQEIAKLQAHAGEVIFDSKTNSYYITNCGWRGYNTPIEGGVAIAKLEFI